MYRYCFKRVIDILIGLIALPFVLLVIISFAPLIWLTDKGPVFYNAPRVGLFCKQFKMYKLRSMYVNSKDIRNTDGSTFNSDEDCRVTPIGHFLRKTSLDEVPQLLNVLIGNMSFVGPRPTVGSVVIDYNKMEGEKKKRYSVKPGITGYAQAYYRNSISQKDKFYLDAVYADNISLWLDIKIVLVTVISVFGLRNINSQ